MSHPQLCIESTLTDKYQTSVPSAVRKALQLSKKDKIKYVIQDNGIVYIQKVTQEETDPVLSAFLSFIERDMQANPQHIQATSLEQTQSAIALVGGDLDIDLDTPLLDENEA